ncbi:MAG TPA: hypothetical protein VFX38_08715 [Gammaproteobacteria bacterium]|nr:hypothetical protein [Gammaproteobacteria bacterium]
MLRKPIRLLRRTERISAPARRRRRALLVGVAVLGAAAAAAPAALSAPPAPVREALAMLQEGRGRLYHAWRYEETITSSQGKERIAHNPSRPPGDRWRVLEVNGKKPSAEQQKQFAARAKDVASTIAASLGTASGWLSQSDYRLVAKSATTLTYQLRPRPDRASTDDSAKLLQHLAGRFVIARADHRPVSLSLDNFESFSPRFGVRIDSFRFWASFRRLGGADGPVVITRTGTSTGGKIFWLKGFQDRTEVILGNFAPASATAAAAAG